MSRVHEWMANCGRLLELAMRRINDTHRVWLAEANRLLTAWTRSGDVPSIETPVTNRSQSDDGRESHTSILWSHSGFERAWGRRIHAVIEEACVDDKRAWRYQLPPYQAAYEQFFSTRQSDSMINMVIATPSRVPRFLWPTQGRPALYERVDPNPIWLAPGEIPVFHELTASFRPALEGLIWAERPGRSCKRLRMARTTAQRRFQGFRTTMDRLFLADREADADSLVAGIVPGLERLTVGSGQDARTFAPMIHLLRLDGEGMLDLVLFEVAYGSGALVQIRWSRQSLASFLIHDPYYAAALRATLDHGRRLIR